MHKKIFSFLICTTIQRYNKVISDDLWNLFVRGVGLISDSKQNEIENPDENFIEPENWSLIIKLSQLVKNLNMFPFDLRTNLTQWKEWKLKKNHYYNDSFPQITNLKEKLPSFIRLFIIRALSKDFIVEYLNYYIEEELGEKFVESSSSSMNEIYSISDKVTPIIFILSQGADPTSSLLKFSNEKKVFLDVISLGQGQGQKAENLIMKAKKKGGHIN